MLFLVMLILLFSKRGLKMKQNLQVLSSELKAGIGKKSGAQYSMIICQCVLTDIDTGEIKVGELTMPKGVDAPAPGLYEAEFKIGIDYTTKKIGGVLVGLKPLKAAALPPPKF
jgi:hypothetical protein